MMAIGDYLFARGGSALIKPLQKVDDSGSSAQINPLKALKDYQ
jgi:hypothetical protein